MTDACTCSSTRVPSALRLCLYTVPDYKAEASVSGCPWGAAGQLWSMSVPHIGVCCGQGKCPMLVKGTPSCLCFSSGLL